MDVIYYFGACDWFQAPFSNRLLASLSLYEQKKKKKTTKNKQTKNNLLMLLKFKLEHSILILKPGLKSHNTSGVVCCSQNLEL